MAGREQRDEAGSKHIVVDSSSQPLPVLQPLLRKRQTLEAAVPPRSRVSSADSSVSSCIRSAFRETARILFLQEFLSASLQPHRGGRRFGLKDVWKSVSWGAQFLLRPEFSALFQSSLVISVCDILMFNPGHLFWGAMAEQFSLSQDDKKYFL